VSMLCQQQLGWLLYSQEQCLGTVRRVLMHSDGCRVPTSISAGLFVEYFSVDDQKPKTRAWHEIFQPSVHRRQSRSGLQVQCRSTEIFLHVGCRIVFSNVLVYKNLDKEECRSLYMTLDGWLPRVVRVMAIFDDGVVCRPENFFDPSTDIESDSNDFFARVDELRECVIVADGERKLYGLLETHEEALLHTFSVAPGDRVRFRDEEPSTARVYRVMRVSWKTPAVISMTVTLDNYVHCNASALEIVEKASGSDVPEWHSDCNAPYVARYRVGAYFKHEADKRLYRVTSLHQDGICASVLDKQTGQIENHVYIPLPKLASYSSLLPGDRKRPMSSSDDVDLKRRRGTPDNLSHSSCAVDTHEYFYQ